MATDRKPGSKSSVVQDRFATRGVVQTTRVGLFPSATNGPSITLPRTINSLSGKVDGNERVTVLIPALYP